MTNEKIYYSNVAKLRESYGLSQKGLADIVGVSIDAISSIERLEYKPSLELAHRIACVLGERGESVFVFEPKKKIIEAQQRKILLDLFIEAKMSKPDDVPWSEWLAEYLVTHGVTVRSYADDLL